MAQYQHLPIFKAAYQLMEAIAIKTKDYPANYRSTIGYQLNTEALALVMSIFKANQHADKSVYIKETIQLTEMIEMLIRLSKDLKLINIESHAKFVELTDSILKQSSGWLRSQIS
jgi:hypothetical protein